MRGPDIDTGYAGVITRLVAIVLDVLLLSPEWPMSGSRRAWRVC